MKIVIRTPNWIGDCIMSIPAIRALKSQCPDLQICLAGKEYLMDIFRHLAEVETFIQIPDRLNFINVFKSAFLLRRWGFKQAILFTNSFSSALIFKLAGIKKVVGYGNDGRGFLLWKKKPIISSLRHHQYFYLDLIEFYTGIKIEGSFSLQLPILPEEKREARVKCEELNIDHSLPMIALSPSAAYGSAKEWLPRNFRELISRLLTANEKCQILLLGNTDEAEKIDSIIQGLCGAVFNLAGRLSLRQTMAIISECALFIGNDSGLMHVAAALKIPLIALFGPTDPQKTSPLGPNTSVVHSQVSCAPCDHRHCPQDHRCMGQISVDRVYQLAEQVIKVKKNQRRPRRIKK